MTAHRIDGKSFAAGLREKIGQQVTVLKRDHSVTPGLAVVLIGEDQASQIYVSSKEKQSILAGMNSYVHRLPSDTSQLDLLALIDQLNNDSLVHGILIQLPLPSHINEADVINAIAVKKDVDGFTVANAGRLATGQRAMVPCTPLGCLMLLRDWLGDLSGKEAVVIGRSNIVGKPMAALLTADNATVTLAHSRTKNLPEVVRRADIIVSAVGQPRMVKRDWVKPGATVIDVGINRTGSGLVGDADYASVSEVAGAITPVPGGVGPMTIACLLANTLVACHRIHGLTDPEGLAH